MDRRPNFFIVGSGKAGTTSLYQYLKQVPGIFMRSKTVFEKDRKRVLCTQPRRANAIGISERVAEEYFDAKKNGAKFVSVLQGLD